MFKKLSTTTLLISFFVLLGIVALIKYYNAQKGEGTFETRLIHIDSSGLKKLEILPSFKQEDQFSLVKEDDGWYVKYNGKKVQADPDKIEKTLQDLFNRLEASSLVSTNKDDWEKYEVDSSGTLIRLYQDENATDELVIGKLTFQSRRIATHYVRKLGKNKVYTVEAYLQASLKSPVKDWINKKVLPGVKAQWNRIAYNYPGDTSFIMNKQDQHWFFGKDTVISKQADNLLNNLSQISTKGEVMIKNTRLPENASFRIVVGNEDGNEASLRIYSRKDHWILGSSINSGNYFKLETKFMNKLLISRNDLLINQPPGK